MSIEYPSTKTNPGVACAGHAASVSLLSNARPFDTQRLVPDKRMAPMNGRSRSQSWLACVSQGASADSLLPAAGLSGMTQFAPSMIHRMPCFVSVAPPAEDTAQLSELPP